MRVDLTGKKFGRLTVEAYVGVNKFKQTMWVCRCRCGGSKTVSNAHLRNGLVKSCGCLAKTHGMSKTSLFNVWSGMLKRCRLKSRKDWMSYGGRGIKVCKRWQKFENFRDDMADAYQKQKSKYGIVILDRIDNDKGYSKRNCRWVTPGESAENRSSSHWLEYNGERKTLTAWAREVGISPTTLSDRLKAGWPLEKALLTPINAHKYAKSPDHEAHS